MNLGTKILIGLWVVLTALVAWDATGPDPYMERLSDISSPRTYPWAYPVTMFLLGGVLLALLRPWQATHSFVRAIAAFVLCVVLEIFLVVSAMHAHPVHGLLMVVILVLSLGLLFYSGFVFGALRANRKRGSGAV